MVVAHPAHFQVLSPVSRIRKKVKNNLVRLLTGPLDERGSSQGAQNWSQIQKVLTRNQLTSQKVHLPRYVGACECQLNLKLAVTYLTYEDNGGPSNHICVLSAPW